MRQPLNGLELWAAHPRDVQECRFLILDSPFPGAGRINFSVWVFRLILAWAAHAAGRKPHRLKFILLGLFFERGVPRGRKSRTFHKTREGCGTRSYGIKTSKPSGISGPPMQSLEAHPIGMLESRPHFQSA